MSSWLLLVLGGLSVYRVALLFSKEAGPGAVFESLRRKAGPKSGVGCILCESVWWSLILGVVLTCCDVIGEWWAPLWVLSWSAVAVVLNSAFTAGSLKK